MAKERWEILPLVSDGGNGCEMYMIRGHVPETLAIEMVDHYTDGSYKDFGEPNIKHQWVKPVPDSTGKCSVLYHTVDPAKCKSAMAVTDVTFD